MCRVMVFVMYCLKSKDHIDEMYSTVCHAYKTREIESSQHLLNLLQTYFKSYQNMLKTISVARKPLLQWKYFYCLVNRQSHMFQNEGGKMSVAK